MSENPNEPLLGQNTDNHEERHSQSTTKKTKTLLQITSIALSTIILIVSIFSYSSTGSFNNSIVDFKDNWELRPIVDVKTSANECPSGYENLIEREWPGTEAGCDCSFSWTYNGLHRGKCDYNQTAAKCVNVEATEAKSLSKFYSYNICAKREGDPYYLTKFAVKRFDIDKDPICPKDYKLCGEGDFDKLVCIRKSYKCPLNDIHMVNNASSIPKGYSSVHLDGGIYVVFTNSSSNRLPTVRIKLTEEQVCANPAEHAVSKGREMYLLLKNSNYNGCHDKIGESFFDPRYRLVSSIREDRLFLDNGVNIITNELPDYPSSDSTKYFWNLFTNDYFYWNPQCETYGDDLTKVFMMKQLRSSVDIYSKELTIMIIAILYFIVCNNIFEYIKYQYKSADDENDRNKATFLAFTQMIKIILITFLIIFFYSCIYSMNVYNASITTLKDAQCSDEFANTMFTEFGNTLSTSNALNYTGICFSILLLIVIISQVVVEFCFTDEKESQIQDGEYDADKYKDEMNKEFSVRGLSYTSSNSGPLDQNRIPGSYRRLDE